MNPRNKVKQRRSAPSAAAGSAAQQQMMPWGAMGPQPMFYSWAPPTQPAFSHQASSIEPANVKPWEVAESDSDTGSDSDCFQPSQKSRKLMQPSAASSKKGLQEKRARGRPSFFETSLPKILEGFDLVSTSKKDECKKCHIYKGSCVLQPCGHALFCKKCVNALRSESIKLKRHVKCLNKSCSSLVCNWIALVNVSA